MTSGALAQQIRSSVASETQGGEVLSPPPPHHGNSKQLETTPGDDVAAKKSSPRFSDFLRGFSKWFGSRVSSPVSKRSE